MKVKEIEKDDILNVKFPNEDVLNTDLKKSNRWLSLKKASHNWNQPRSELKIVFKSQSKGMLSVNSIVNNIKPEYVILSGGYVIPIRSIYEVH